jgi:hypothetical protein
MQPKASVQVNRSIRPSGRGYRDARPDFVVTAFEEWNNHVQAVGCATLEDCDQDFVSSIFLRCGPNKPGGNRRLAGNGAHRHQ